MSLLFSVTVSYISVFTIIYIFNNLQQWRQASLWHNNMFPWCKVQVLLLKYCENNVVWTNWGTLIRLIMLQNYSYKRISVRKNYHNLLTMVVYFTSFVIHVQYSYTMQFIGRHNRHHKVSLLMCHKVFFICHKIVAVLLRIRVRGTFRDAYTICLESRYLVVFNNPLFCGKKKPDCVPSNIFILY